MSTVRPELITCYYYGPHFHTLLTRHLDWDLDQMAKMGTDAVAVSMQEPYQGESQLMIHSHATIRQLVARIHRFGLKAFAVPNRWGRLLAGWLDGASMWMMQNPDALKNSGEWELKSDIAADPTHAKTRTHFEQNLREMFTKFEFDGLIWDEPRPPSAQVAKFLDEMAAFAKSIRPGLIVSLFAEAGVLDFATPLAATSNIDYLGADGHLRSNDHQMFRMKNTIFTTHAHFTPILKSAGKKTFFLLEGQRHRDEDLGNYLANVERAFALPMDHLMYYYCAHEMNPENADRMTKATWDQVAMLSGARLKSS